MTASRKLHEYGVWDDRVQPLSLHPAEVSTRCPAAPRPHFGASRRGCAQVEDQRAEVERLRDRAAEAEAARLGTSRRAALRIEISLPSPSPPPAILSPVGDGCRAGVQVRPAPSLVAGAGPEAG